MWLWSSKKRDQFMRHAFATLAVLIAVAGCGDQGGGGAREVPVSRSSTTPPSNPNAATKDARAIATH